MRMAIALSVAVLLGGSAAAACGSTGSSADVADAGSDGGPAGGDANSSADAGTLSDAGPGQHDAATDGSAGDAGPTYCTLLSVAPAFCDDFDRGPVGATWDAITKVAPGTATLDDAASVSAPSSLFIQTAATVDTSFGTVLLRKTVTTATPVKHARLSFDFNPDDATPSGGSLGIATLDLSTAHLFTLYLRDPSATPGPALVEAASVETRFALTGALPPTGTWTTIVVDLDLTAAVANVSFGKTAVLVNAPIGTTTGTQPTIRVGALAEGPASAYHVHIDNVILEAD